MQEKGRRSSSNKKPSPPPSSAQRSLDAPNRTRSAWDAKPAQQPASLAEIMRKEAEESASKKVTKRRWGGKTFTLDAFDSFALLFVYLFIYLFIIFFFFFALSVA
jgi:hypothetical protein